MGRGEKKGAVLKIDIGGLWEAALFLKYAQNRGARGGGGLRMWGGQFNRDITGQVRKKKRLFPCPRERFSDGPEERRVGC